jgi:hypothetical protein
MIPQDWIIVILTGGILGAVGQSIRVIVGLKKVYDESLQRGTSFSQDFNGSSLLFSLLIGFIAGVLGIVGLVGVKDAGDNLTREQVITLIGLGYAGADFIEGFVKKNTAKFGLAQAPASAAVSVHEPEQPPMG